MKRISKVAKSDGSDEGKVLLFRQAVDEAAVTREPGAPAVTRLTGCRTGEAVGGPVKDPSPS